MEKHTDFSNKVNTVIESDGTLTLLSCQLLKLLLPYIV